MAEDVWIDPVNTRATRGAYHRRVLAVAGPDVVRAGMEDEPHHFEVTVWHDGGRITGVEGRALRYPWNTCPGASAKLEQFIGEEISLRRGAFIDPRMHCTHQYDLIRFAIAQAARHAAGGNARRQYDLRLLDRVHTNWRAEVWRDHELALYWELEDERIIAPLPFRGMDTQRRLDWGDPDPDPDLVEAALMLRRGLLVARTRQPENWQFRQGWPEDVSPRDEGHTPGVCHTYSDEFIDAARPLKSWVDLSFDQNRPLAAFSGVWPLGNGQ